MGYDPADTDPYQVVRRQMAADAQAAREAAAPGGTQPFQAVRKLQQQIADLQDLVVRLPQVESYSAVANGFGLDSVSGWRTVASLTVPALVDKNRVVIQASAQGAVLDTTSGGLTSSECRLLINGVASSVIPAAKDAGASVVQNVLIVTFTQEVTPIPSGGVSVEFQINPLNYLAFPPQSSNIANLTVYAGYSVV